MSRRSALLAAIVAGLVVIAFLFWPERAAADSGFSARHGGKVGHVSGIGGRLHLGNRAVLRGARGHGSFHHRGFHHRGFQHGRKHVGAHLGDRFRFYQRQRISDGKPRRHGVLLGDRFRFEQRERLSDRRIPPRAKLGGVFLHNQRQRLDNEFLGPDFASAKRGRHGKFHRRGLHGKWLRPAPLLLPYGGADVVVREIIVPVPVPAARPAAVTQAETLDPRGRASLIGEEEGVVGDWAAGDVLPDGLPHVALDPVSYGLPDPPFGQKYARVGNDVLRIVAGSRRIVEVVAR